MSPSNGTLRSASLRDHVDADLAGGQLAALRVADNPHGRLQAAEQHAGRPVAPGWSAARPAPKRSIGAYGRPAEASRSAAATTSTSGRPRSSASSYGSGSDGRL
jgi:hypothetical protein